MLKKINDFLATDRLIPLSIIIHTHIQHNLLSSYLFLICPPRPSPSLSLSSLPSLSLSSLPSLSLSSPPLSLYLLDYYYSPPMTPSGGHLSSESEMMNVLFYSK